jgi:hypothetical protein
VLKTESNGDNLSETNCETSRSVFPSIEGKTLREVSQFVSDKLSPLDSVLSTKTNFILKKYKDHGTVMAEPAKDERIEM